jgi:hypothetical protein
VREAAIRRTGTMGQRLALAVPVTTVLSVLLVIAYVVIVALEPSA